MNFDIASYILQVIADLEFALSRQPTKTYSAINGNTTLIHADMKERRISLLSKDKSIPKTREI
jgi:hypothetical protein